MNESSLPNGWAKAQLREVVTKLVDGSHNPPSAQAEGLPMLSARNIEDDRVVWSDYRLIAPSDFEREDSRTRVGPGDVLLTIVGTIGRAACVRTDERRFALQRSVAVLRPVGLEGRYLMYLVQSPSFARFLADSAKGTAQKGVYLKVLADAPVVVAPNAEQVRLTEALDSYLSRLDAATEGLNRVEANLKRYRASVLKAAVEGRLLPTEAELAKKEGRPYEPAAVARINKTRGNGGEVYLPDGWCHATLGEVIESLDQGWSPQCEKHPSGASEWGVIKTTAIQHLTFVEIENKALPQGFTPRPRLELQADDLLVTRAGPRSRVGVCCLVRRTRPRLMLCDKAYRLRVSRRLVIPEYLEIALNSPGYLDEIEKRKSGISDSGVNLTQDRFRELNVSLPPVCEQERIVAEVGRILSDADAVLAAAITNGERITRLRQAVLKWAFAGKLVDQDPNDEPASVLLHRIHQEREAAATAATGKRRPAGAPARKTA